MATSLIVLFICSVLWHAFFHGYEVALSTSDHSRIRAMENYWDAERVKRLLSYIEQPDRVLSLLVFGSALAFSLGALSAYWVVSGTVVDGGALSSAGLASVVLTVAAFFAASGIVADAVFSFRPEFFAYHCLPLIGALDRLSTPITAPLASTARFLLRRTGGGSVAFRPHFQSLDDVRVLVDESATLGSIEPEEQEMIHSVIDLQSTHAKELMAPRVEIQALSETATRTEFIEMIARTGKTRIPVYRESIDNIVGVANAYDVLTDPAPEDETLARFISPALHVPDTTKVDDLLELFKDSSQHLAIVTDEYGGTDGLISLEDILEEIFGEIHDEYDREENLFQRIGHNAFVVDGRLPLTDLAERANLVLDDEEVETVGGWVMHIAGRIPVQGEVIHHDGFKVTVLAGGRNFVSRVRVEVIEGPADGEKETTEKA